ncbi:site-specific integrase [Nocardia sp. NBC_00881]|uniref:tyrosine-type recombinase/integrase n=1 Tax=Nocardia sp. NBC_00881 TaxID=2975995 RepID=UPI003863D636|nr:site-specific integrase [Nocardia sp. NBC_00881]
MTSDVRTVADPVAIEATRILLSQVGITPADLLTESPKVPTFGHAIPKLRATLTPGTLRTYNTHLIGLENTWHNRQLDAVSKADLDEKARTAQAASRGGRGTHTGASAREHFISTVRCLYRYAEDNNWIHPTRNPARHLAIPARSPSRRQAISSPRLAEICEVASLTGNDPELDALILRLHIETACRRSSALRLRPCDLDPHQCLLLLREKEGIHRWQPISPTLMRHLLRHAEQRGSPPQAQLLRYRNGKPITARRYDHLWNRVGVHLPWVATHGITIHWLRHTTLTWVERTFGYATARTYAGHRTRTSGTTATYVKANLYEIAAVLAVLTREPHPLLSNQPNRAPFPAH